MPAIGRPEAPGSNPFKKIEMGSPKDNRAAQKLGDELNIISGRQPKSMFHEGPHNQIGKDGFLKLLTHQLQNQDPINPMDQKQFAADLAQFSQLEQLTNMRTELKKLQEITPDQKKSIAANFIGKEISTNGVSVNFEGQGTFSEVQFSLAKPAARVIVRLMDQKGNTVAEIPRDAMGAGLQSVSWDGVQNDKSMAPKGTYHVSVHAWDDGFNPMKPQTHTSGVIQGVSFQGEDTVLHVNGKKIFLRDVKSFSDPKNKIATNLNTSHPSMIKPPVKRPPVSVNTVQNYGQ